MKTEGPAVPNRPVEAGLSIIVPALNEAVNLPFTLDGLAAGGLDLIVVDGGSRDDTVDIARRLGARVFSSEPGRARQMNRGAQEARCSALLFLHADTLLPKGFSLIIDRVLSRPGVACGAFQLKIDDERRSYRWIEKAVNLRSRFLGLPYGDQAFFIRTKTFHRIGGFPDLPLMEDFELIRRAKRVGRIALADEPVLTSARRWNRLGPWKTTLVNQVIISLYLVGVSPKRLACLYMRAKMPRCRN